MDLDVYNKIIFMILVTFESKMNKAIKNGHLIIVLYKYKKLKFKKILRKKINKNQNSH